MNHCSNESTRAEVLGNALSSFYSSFLSEFLLWNNTLDFHLIFESVNEDFLTQIFGHSIHYQYIIWTRIFDNEKFHHVQQIKNISTILKKQCITLYPPKCLTWHVNVASLPIATLILKMGSANSGWKANTPEKNSNFEYQIKIFMFLYK